MASEKMIHANIPRLQKSTGAEYPLFVRTSGAIYAILPATPVNSLLSEKWTAILKSVICACPLSSSNMLSGLRSLKSQLGPPRGKDAISPPVYYPFCMKVIDSHCYFGDIESNYLFVHCSCSVQMD